MKPTKLLDCYYQSLIRESTDANDPNSYSRGSVAWRDEKSYNDHTLIWKEDKNGTYSLYHNWSDGENSFSDNWLSFTLNDVANLLSLLATPNQLN